MLNKLKTIKPLCSLNTLEHDRCLGGFNMATNTSECVVHVF